MNIQLVTADNNIVTQSVSLVPISYPTNVNNSTALGDVIYFTNSPITASLVSTNYKVECNNEAHNNWYVIVSGSTFSSYSGSVYSGSICQVSMNLIDYLGNPFSGSVAISPLITNALFSGSTNSLILKDTLYYTASANGNLTASLLPLPYLFKAFGAIKHPKFTFYPTASCNINLCETTVTNIAPIITATNNSSYGYTAQASDARYLGINATASYATLSATASYFSGSISNANTSLSASYSTTSSYALNGGGSGTSLTTGSTYPITASISLTASAVTVNATATNNNYYLMFTPTTGSITPLIDSGLTSYYNPNTDTFTALHISASNVTASLNAANALVNNLIVTNYIQNTGNTAINSNVIGNSAGVGSVGTYNNFIGNSAGNAANNASYSNFIGVSCGTSTNSASYSNFIGYDVGAYAINASQSNFIGVNAGVSSTNAYNSNFIGYRAGGSATNFNNAIAIGYQAGYGEFVNNNNGHSSILIGDFTLANGFKDSITIGKGTQNSAAGQCNIGNSLFINGIYSGSSTTSTPQLNITVGLGTNTPVNTLDVVGNISCSVITASLHLGTASYSNYSATASILVGPIASASYATLAATASYYSGSISNANTATTASYAATSSWPFFPVSSTQIETLQSVGIQTNNPLYPLHVYGPLMVEGNPTPRIYAKSNDGSNSLVFDRYTGQSSYAMYFGENADTGATYFRGAGNFYVGNQSTPAIFANGNTGQVGINNITSPVNSLDVNGNISCSVITASSLIGNTIVLNSTTYTSSSINTTIGSVLGGYSIINGGGNKISQLSVIAGTAVIPGTAQFSNINGNTVGIDSGGNLSASYNLYVNGSIIGNLTGSLLGTSSWATNVVNGASYNNTSSALLVSGSIGLTISQSTITANTSPTSSLPALNVETYWSGSTTSTYGSLIQGVANWTGSGLSAVSYLLDLRNYNPATAPNNFGFQVLSNGNIKLGTIGNQYCMMQFANSQMFLSANGSSTYDMALCTNGGYTLNVGSGNTFGWCSTAGANTLANVDTRLVRDAANTIGQRNGGNYTASVPQAYNLYNYYSASNDKQYLSSYWTGSNYYLQLFSTGSASGSANINLVTSGSVNITQQLQFTSSNSPALNVVSYISASSNTNPTMSLIAGTVNWSGSYLSSTNAYLLNLNAYNNTSSYGNYIFQVTPQGNVNMGSTQINQINNQASIMGFALGNTAGNNSVQFATNGGSIVSLGKGMNLGWSATTYAATLSGNDTLINRYSAGVVNISSSLMVNNISCSVITGSTLMQLPISSSAVIFNSSSNLITGSAYVLASATTPLFYVYLGTRWYSSSLA